MYTSQPARSRAGAFHQHHYSSSKVAFHGMLTHCMGSLSKETSGLLPSSLLFEFSNVQVTLLENVRFYKEETKNDPGFAEKMAANADLFVNDAFGTAHRAHASTEGVTKYLKPNVAGFLLQKELDYLDGAVRFHASLGALKPCSARMPKLCHSERDRCPACGLGKFNLGTRAHLLAVMHWRVAPSELSASSVAKPSCVICHQQGGRAQKILKHKQFQSAGGGAEEAVCGDRGRLQGEHQDHGHRGAAQQGRHRRPWRRCGFSFFCSPVFKLFRLFWTTLLVAFVIKALLRR